MYSADIENSLLFNHIELLGNYIRLCKKDNRCYTFVMFIFCLLFQSYRLKWGKTLRNKTEEGKKATKIRHQSSTRLTKFLFIAVNYLSSRTNQTSYMRGQNSKKTVIHQVQHEAVQHWFSVADPSSSKQLGWMNGVTTKKSISPWWLDPSPNQVENHLQQALLHSELEPEPKLPACRFRSLRKKQRWWLKKQH